MTEKELRKYMQRFPISTRQALENDKIRSDFLNSVQIVFEPIKVYRAVKCISDFSVNDFISIPDEREMTPEQIANRVKKDKNLRAGFFGVSVNEDINEMIVSLKFPNARHGNILCGEMRYENGIADFEDGETHHNWYIFRDKINEVLKSFHFIKFLRRRH